MARLLVIDPQGSHAAGLEAVLRQSNHQVSCVAPEELRFPIGQYLVGFDFVIVNMTLNRDEDWKVLRRLCHASVADIDSPRVIAVSEIYRGPQPRLEAERLGCVWIYDHPRR